MFRLDPNDRNFAALWELFTGINREPLIAQKFLSDVSQGDKRIILVDGEPVGAINRMPAEGETRSNMHAGGTPVPTKLTDREREICAAIGPLLREKGQVFVGIDVIGGWLTEINVTSPPACRSWSASTGSTPRRRSGRRSSGAAPDDRVGRSSAAGPPGATPRSRGSGGNRPRNRRSNEAARGG